MPKNVVVCCDGTANEFAVDKTNVIKLFITLRQDPATQVTYYHPGLGTMEPPGALTPVQRRVTRTLGMTVGYGLERDVQDAYVFLMRNFEPGDKLFLFGFSRGAYTARAVASLLHMYGLIRRDNEALVLYAIRMLLAIHRSETRTSDAVNKYFRLARQFKEAMGSRLCKPWFVGVWDTVSSVGWVANPLHLPFVANNPDIDVGRHAVAIDERRAFFRTELWRAPTDPSKPVGPKDVKQVWFPGVHCDVGGGYPESESGLSKLSLGWMLREAQAFGLGVDSEQMNVVMGTTPGAGYVAPDPNALAHESLKGLWNLAEYVPKHQYDWTTGAKHWRISAGAKRFIPPGSLVHVSAFQRGGGYASRLPPGTISTQ